MIYEDQRGVGQGFATGRPTTGLGCDLRLTIVITLLSVSVSPSVCLSVRVSVCLSVRLSPDMTHAIDCYESCYESQFPLSMSLSLSVCLSLPSPPALPPYRTASSIAQNWDSCTCISIQHCRFSSFTSNDCHYTVQCLPSCLVVSMI